MRDDGLGLGAWRRCRGRWPVRPRLVCTIHRRNVRYTAAGAYCSRVEYNNNNNITCLRPSAFAPGPSFEITSCFLFLLSYFLVRLLTFVSTTCPEVRLTFGGGPCYPLPPTFVLRSFVFTLPLIFCILPLLICATAHKILLVPPISQFAITPSAPPHPLFPQCEFLALLCTLSLLLPHSTSVSAFFVAPALLSLTACSELLLCCQHWPIMKVYHLGTIDHIKRHKDNPNLYCTMLHTYGDNRLFVAEFDNEARSSECTCEFGTIKNCKYCRYQPGLLARSHFP